MTCYALGDQTPIFPNGGEFWIAPGAHVIGNVVIGEGVSIWFGAVVRGDNEPIVLAEGSNVQDNFVLHTDPGFPLRIGRECTIGHGAIVHGCIVGDRSLIGMGATVLNGAEIGRDCLVGAGTLITEGIRIPDRSLVLGVPGRVVRELTADQVADLDQAARHYRARIRQYGTKFRARDCLDDHSESRGTDV